MSQSHKFDRYAARSEDGIFESAGSPPLGFNVIVFQRIKAPSRPENDRSARASAQIIPFNARRRSRLLKSASKSWWGENANDGNSDGRDEYSRRRRENILAIGWVGTFMAISYCIMTMPIPMN